MRHAGETQTVELNIRRQTSRTVFSCDLRALGNCCLNNRNSNVQVKACEYPFVLSAAVHWCWDAAVYERDDLKESVD